MIIDKNKRFAFIHIPKNGGTSIRNSLLRVGGKNIGNMWHYQYWEREDILTDIPFVFAISRHPFDRLFSYWKYILGSIKDTGTGHRRYNELKRQHVYCVQNGLKGFLNLRKETGMFPQNNGSFFSADPQVEWGKDSGGNMKVKWFKLTELQKLKDTFKKNYNLDLSIGHQNKQKQNYFLGSNQYFSGEIKELVCDIYKEDFKILDYEK